MVDTPETELPSLSVELDVALTPVEFRSQIHPFSIDDLNGTYGGVSPDIDTDGSWDVAPCIDKNGNALHPVDSKIGFYASDFVGAEDKVLDGDYSEGCAGNMYDDQGNAVGVAPRNSPTDLFNSGGPPGA